MGGRLPLEHGQTDSFLPGDTPRGKMRGQLSRPPSTQHPLILPDLPPRSHQEERVSSGQNVSSREAKKGTVSLSSMSLTLADSGLQLKPQVGGAPPTGIARVPNSVMAPVCCQPPWLLQNVRDLRAETMSQSEPSARSGTGPCLSNAHSLGTHPWSPENRARAQTQTRAKGAPPCAALMAAVP